MDYQTKVANLLREGLELSYHINKVMTAAERTVFAHAYANRKLKEASQCLNLK